MGLVSRLWAAISPPAASPPARFVHGTVQPQRYSEVFGPPSPDDDRFFDQQWSSGQSDAGIRVTADGALKVSAVFRCVSILSDILGTMPCQMYRKTGANSLDPAPNHPLEDLLTLRPNAWQTPAEFWGMMGFHAALRGVAYAEILPGPRGAVDQLLPIHPDRVTAEQLDDFTLRFKVRDVKTGRERIILQEDMLRIPGMTSDGINGLRTIDLASNSIALLMAADAYAGRTFSNRLNMGGFLKHPAKMSPEAQRRFIGRMMSKFAGWMNPHRPMLLTEGMDFVPASMKADEAQLLEARKWQIGDIARFWGVPLHMLGIDDQTNRSTVEEQSLNFVRHYVRPWIEKVQQAIARDLILVPAVYKAVFNLDDLERGNMAARAAYFRAALGGGGTPAWLSQDEVRQEEGYNPRGGKADTLSEGATAAGKQKSAPPQPAPQPANNNNAAPAAITAPPAQIEDGSLEARAHRLARLENKALRRATMRHADDVEALRSWVKAFYSGHVSSVMEILDIPKDAARAYCAFQRDEALLANDLLGLITRREETLAETIVATLRRNGEQNHG